MQLEIKKAYKKRRDAERRRQERQELSPVTQLQSQARGVEDLKNPRSARAEEQLLALILQQPALLDGTAALSGEKFSVPLFGRVFDALRERWRGGFTVSLGVLEELTQKEMTYLAGEIRKWDGLVNEKAFRDCVKLVLEEHRKDGETFDEQSLMRIRQAKQKKG